jgi:diaminopimelate epimerase
MHFIKYQGLGNDFVLLLGTGPETPPIAPALAARICARGHGVGADGVMRLRPGGQAHLAMELLNADGSTPEMCGNGIRCLVKYAVEELGWVDSPLDVATVAGLRRCTYTLDDLGKVASVRVGMGRAQVEPRSVDGHDGWYVDVGNPHFVLFREETLAPEVARSLGAALSSHEAFPEGCNIEFVRTLAPDHLEVTVYERGCGLTKACGTGATAVVAAAVQSQRAKANEDIRVSLPGGDLEIRVSQDGQETWMEGPATEVYRGQLSER